MSIQSLLSIQTLSLVLLLVGVGLAFSQIRISGWILGWVLLSGALLLQGFRSLLSYVVRYGGVDAATYSVANDWMGLGFSLLILAAMPMMRDVFVRQKSATENLRAVSAAASDGIVILDSTGSIAIWNRAAEGIFGYRETEVVGKRLDRLIVPESGRLEFENSFRQFSDIDPADAGSAPKELSAMRKDGVALVTEYTISRVDTADDWHAIYIFRDITARRQAEAALRRTEARKGKMFANIGDVIVILDEGGVNRYQSPNIEKWFGWKPEEIIGGNPWEHVHPDDVEATRSFFGALQKERNATGTTECRYQCKDGNYRTIRITVVNLLHDPDIRGFLGNYHDITEQKKSEAAQAQLEAQLRESQKMEAIGTLAGGIAHDFNNALATILGNVELARQDASNNPQALESLEEIRKAGSRARGLVQQILSFSRRQPTERKLLALAPVVEESVLLLRATIPARLAIEVQCDAGVPRVLADASHMQQVLINLATNAFQAMHTGPGRIRIRLDTVWLDAAMAESHPVLGPMFSKDAGRLVRLAVSDDGPGMDEATLAHIFEPFFTTKSVDEGTGLGLAVVHGIVQAHEGAIEVDSRLGEGATFTIYLPVADASTGQVVQETAGAAASGRAAGGRHILYLDDDESLVFLVKRLLERRGYRLSGFTDQQEALAALRGSAHDFDLVVTDYNMPGISGLDVAHAVRQIRGDLPVAIASGFIDEALQSQSAAAGVRELIFKASAVEDLCDAFARLANAAGDPTSKS